MRPPRVRVRGEFRGSRPRTATGRATSVVIALGGTIRGSRVPGAGCDPGAVPVSPALRPYLLACADDLDSASDKADVHDLRVAARRVRSVLRSCRSLAVGGDTGTAAELVERCRELGSNLGGTRDDEVAVEVLRGWADDDGWPATTVGRLLREIGLPTQRDSNRPVQVPAELLDGAKALAVSVRALVEDADAVAESEPGPAGSDPLQPVVRAERRRVLRRAKRATAPEQWHDVRKAAKRLRYTAEAQRARLPSGDADDVVSAAKELQTALGDLRDVEELTDRLMQAPPGPLVDRALARAVRTSASLRQTVDPALDRLRST